MTTPITIELHGLSAAILVFGVSFFLALGVAAFVAGVTQLVKNGRRTR